jgi:hypothetical protein
MSGQDNIEGEVGREFCVAETQPADYVREFMKQLAHPETRLRTDTRSNPDDVWGSTNWGDAGRAAILAVLQKSTTT